MRRWTVMLVLLALTHGVNAGEASVKDTTQYKTLTAEEARVIVHKGTERPFSGQYDDFDETGSYHCKRCGALLYRSDDKFKSGCGWPSFDDEVPGAVRRETDADGRRTEILCAACGGHLGHVFEGERLTEKNVRHCVNSISLDFKPVVAEARAYFAGGCFWGVEHLFAQRDGVIAATSGYMGGSQERPSYEDVIYRNTGHLEAVEVRYNPAEVSYEALARYFFEIHDPTQKNGQGPDIGAQYLSAVFVGNGEEEETVKRLIGLLEKKGYNVATKILSAAPFWKAEDYHQDYYDKKGTQPYCHAWQKRF